MKCRRVACEIRARYFKPQGIPLRLLDEIELSLDELEAMRLTDVEDLYQADAAARMGVSRQTLGNIVAKAHKKVARALLGGHALRIGAVDGPVAMCAQEGECARETECEGKAARMRETSSSCGLPTPEKEHQ
jgi:predicted DNA-binding protein (UPF0251 family)